MVRVPSSLRVENRDVACKLWIEHRIQVRKVASAWVALHYYQIKNPPRPSPPDQG